MKTRSTTLYEIAESLKDVLRDIEQATNEALESEYGNTINKMVETLRKVKNQVNQYLDDEEFFNTDRL